MSIKKRWYLHLRNRHDGNISKVGGELHVLMRYDKDTPIVTSNWFCRSMMPLHSLVEVEFPGRPRPRV